MATQLPPRQRGRSSCPGNGDTLGGDAARRRDERAARRASRQAEAERQARLRGKLAAAMVALAVIAGVGGSCARGARVAREDALAAVTAQARQSAGGLGCEMVRGARAFAAGYVQPTSTAASEWAAGKMPYLYQIDAAFADDRYSNGPISLQGCGPFALDMVYIDLTGDTSMGPIEMAAYATSNGYSTDRNGSAWALVGSGAAGLGLKSEVLGASTSSLRAALQAGKDVICVMGPGTFTRVGHFIALDGLDADGRAIVHDSNSYLRSHQSWDLNLIVSEMSCAWALSVA